jgi:hypothetical protein
MKKKIASKKKSAATMLSHIQSIAAEYPEHAGKYALARVPKAAAAEKRCVLWGRDPVTGEKVCLKWEPAD